MKHRDRDGKAPPGGRTVRWLWLWTPLAGLALLIALSVFLEGPTPLRREACWSFLWDYDEVLDVASDFEGFDNVSGAFSASAPSPLPPSSLELIVPNIVHFLRMGQPEFTFLEYVCALAAWERQQPDWLMFHSDLLDFRGEYWMRLQATPGLREAIQLVPTSPLKDVLGQPLDPVHGKQHAADVQRIVILQNYGGIFLDNDVYLLDSLDPLRRFEMSVGWPEGADIGRQVLVAHEEARFLRAWLESYRGAYVGSLRDYNAATRPTQVILHARPELVHRVPVRLGVGKDVPDVLYLRRGLQAWRRQGMLAVPLAERHTAPLARDAQKLGLSYPVNFTEDNICSYNVTVLQLAQAVLPSLCRAQ
ncbi:uncharacterized protein LOC117640268 isoform X2 [Thrips palmi]|uniref:Uncharacterized protein LOC117640268 isoform X2 n=1 Tax=Thrips palmi TaxID=161013 RepID=A0A6P8ZHV6_THRPL|nr:uncharacterized protein LOC117640268 isoform X2 [Thrips palmi]